MLLLDNDQHRLGETVNLAELKLYSGSAACWTVEVDENEN